MFDDLVGTTAGARGATAVQAWARVESAACARRLAAMVAMLDEAYAAEGSADREQWCVDNFEAVAAHIAAVQRVTTHAAENLLFLAAALHEQFPTVAAVFADGLIDLQIVRTIIARTRLAILPDARRQIDAALATALRQWEPRSKAKTEQFIDAIIEQFDPNAVLRTQTKARGRSVDITIEDGTGLATLYATLFAPDAVALDARLDALAETVCPGDPRTKKQRRADAMGALAHGADRLPCLCDTPGCSAAAEPPPSGVVIYVVAHQDTIQDPTAVPEAETADEVVEGHVADGVPVPEPEIQTGIEPESASDSKPESDFVPETTSELGPEPVASVSLTATTPPVAIEPTSTIAPVESPTPSSPGLESAVVDHSPPRPPRRPRGPSP